MAAPNILKLGLLFETDTDVASVRKQPRYVSFPHKLMQEFFCIIVHSSYSEGSKKYDSKSIYIYFFAKNYYLEIFTV